MKERIKQWIKHQFDRLVDAVERRIEMTKRVIATVVAAALVFVTAVVMFFGLAVFAVALASQGYEPEPAAVVATATGVVEPTPTELPPTPTQQESPTATGTATATPIPTLTPTDTPEPPSPTPTVDPREGEYVVWGVGVGESLSYGFSDLADLNEELAANPYVVLNQGWRDDAVAVMTDVKLAANEVIDYPLDDVPDRFRPSHDELVLGAADARDAIDKYAVFLDTLTEGLQNDDVDKINEAGDVIEEVTALMQSADGHLESATDLLPEPPEDGG